MPESPTTARPLQHEKEKSSNDHTLTICAISIVAAILSNTLHEGVGHGLTALLTGAKSGILTTAAWSSAFDSRLVEAGGTLVNLAAALVFWLFFRSARNALMSTRYFLLITCGFNLFSGTGYFFFFRCDELRRLGGCDFRATPALAVADAARGRRSGGLLRRSARRGNRTRALRGSAARPAEANAKVDHPAVLLGHCVVEHSGVAESIRNSTAVAIRSACNRRWSERASVVAVLHSAKNSDGANDRTT